MGRNLEKDLIEMASKNQRILESGFRLFSTKSIEMVTMNDVAKEAGLAVSSLYRYYSTKPKLVTAVGTWAWGECIKANTAEEPGTAIPGGTAADLLDLYLSSFLVLYRDYKDLLRFNQFFNVYLTSEAVSVEDRQPYIDLIRSLETRFGAIYRRGLQDGTLRTDVPENEMFSVTLHLMLAAVTRYAVGLVYIGETAPDEELRMMKDMLLSRYCVRVEQDLA